MDFSKLRGRIAEKGFTRALIAKRLGVSEPTLRAKMSGKTDWKLSEIYMLMFILDISAEEIGAYFFTPELRKI